jgi:2-desacetyl-2-hydroxyethyl bacteriochlorophyllide A dehydrogenase
MPGIKSNGGFAEYASVPERCVHRIPQNISFKVATLIEPVSCALHMINESGIRAGDLVVIIGGGTMGLISLLLCKHYGASKIVLSEPVRYKREMAKQLGADVICDPAKDSLSTLIKEISSHGADIVLDHVGSSATICEGYKCLRKKGRMIISGLNSETVDIPVPSQDIVRNELMIKGVFLNPNTFTRALDLMESGTFPWECLFTHEYPLSEIEKAFETLAEGEAVKVLVKINE